ncbi:unnamed protein product [Tilletia controversa]|nr:unnamed protein product [Tilletia controversa]
MSKQTFKIVVLAGDGIGPEVTDQAVRVLELISQKSTTFSLELEQKLFGGAAIDASGHPLPEDTLEACRAAHAILLGAVGGPKPALFPSESLLSHSPLKAEIAKGTEIIVVRELVKGLYFGDRKEADLDDPNGDGEAIDSMVYDRADVQRITRLAAQLALKQNPPAKIHSIDKANVLATSRLWRRVVTETLEKEFAGKGIELDHQLVDSAAMVMVSNPRKLNGILLTENMFGDILSDESSVIPGSLGLLPSASLSGMPDGVSPCLGLYEPIHGSAPDIAGQGIANPIGTILSAALMLRYSLGSHGASAAEAIEAAVRRVLDTPEVAANGFGLRTRDLGGEASTKEVGDKVLEALAELL